jgi:uncharacterized protein YndB with AHSA1/START domain
MSSENETHDLVVTRRFDVPRERVWQAWRDPDEVMRWWGPQGFTLPMCRMDFREGGTILVCMRSVEGWELYNTWTYGSIEPMDRIEFVQGFADEDGNRVSPAQLGLPPGIPEEVRNMVSLSAIDETTTELTVREYGYPNAKIVEISGAGLSNASTRWRRASRLPDRGIPLIRAAKVTDRSLDEELSADRSTRAKERFLR